MLTSLRAGLYKQDERVSKGSPVQKGAVQCSSAIPGLEAVDRIKTAMFLCEENKKSGQMKRPASKMERRKSTERTGEPT